VIEDLIDAAGDVLFSNLDSKLPTAVETAGREVVGADDGAVSIGENKLGMELDVLELSFDTFILKNTEAADSLAQLLLLQFVGWPSHHMDVDPSVGCPHEMFDNDGVLVTLVLEPQRMSGVIDKLP
jgi:hypothetical protein